MSVDGVSPPTNMRPSVASGKTLELAPGKHLLRVKWVQGIQSLNGGGSGHTGRTDIHAEIVPRVFVNYSILTDPHEKDITFNGQPGHTYKFKWEEVPDALADPGTQCLPNLIRGNMFVSVTMPGRVQHNVWHGDITESLHRLTVIDISH